MSECKIDGHSGGWDRHGKAYCLTCGESNNENDGSAKAFEKWWRNNPKNELVLDTENSPISKSAYENDQEVWQAAVADTEKRLLLSRVELPERLEEDYTTMSAQDLTFAEGHNSCLDAIKLVPMKIEEP